MHFFALVHGGEAQDVAYFASLTPALERLGSWPRGAAYVIEYTLITAPYQRFVASPWRWLAGEEGPYRTDHQ